MYVLSKVAPGVVGALTTSILTRVLVPARYGVYGLALVIMTLGSSIGFEWLRVALIRFHRIGQDDQRTFGTFICLFLVLNVVYRDTLSFLRLDYDGRTEFSAQNPRAEARMKSAEIALRVLFQLKRALGITGGTGLLRPITNWNRRPVEKPAISQATRRELIECFRQETEILTLLTGRDLRRWFE